MDAMALQTSKKRNVMQSKIHLEQSYAHPRAKVWRALIEPALMQKWGMRPEGFEGLGGFMLSRFILKPGWKVMLRKRLAKVIGGVE